jgi:two-component system, cell cycle response regulator
MHILIADDDPVARLVLNRTLTRLGHTVIAFDNGSDAIEALLTPNGPCFAILDWMMPGADGLTVCRTIRKRETPYVYVILLTSRDSLADMVEGLDAGADDFLGKPFDAIELRARLKSGDRVLTLQANLLEASAALAHQASHDRLTGLWNRGMILDHLKRTVSREQREQQAVSVLIADIDHFKAVNDRYGHLTGDVVLREIGRRMKAALRDYDAIGRYGGEEFLVVVSGDAALARELAERLRTAIGSAPIVDDQGREVTVTASFGLATSRTIGFDTEALIRAADDALYGAKAAGRDQVKEG